MTNSMLDKLAEQDILDNLELDIRTADVVDAAPAFRSWSLCTPGCTSQNGGSGCSFCC